MIVNNIGKDFPMHFRVDRESGVLKAQLTRWLFVALLFLGAFSPPQSAGAQGVRLNEDIIADPMTGAAILGFDPIAFFVEQRAVPGHSTHQTMFGGKVWYFMSGANKSVFEASPEHYLPAFGGYDPVAVAAGIPLPGSPNFFVVDAERVFLFRSRDSRDAFARDPSIAGSAERSWPQVKRDLVP